MCHAAALYKNVVVGNLRARQLRQLRGQVVLQRGAYRPPLQRQHSHRVVALVAVLFLSLHARMGEEAAVDV